MPELPEVEVTRRGIAAPLLGARVLAARLGKPLRWPLGRPVESLAGGTLGAVARRGKYLWLPLRHGSRAGAADDGGLLLHLGMSGSLALLREAPEAGPHDHFDLVTDRGTLRLNDPRRFGAVVWSASLQAAPASTLLQRLGAEPFDPALTPAVTGWAAHARPFLFEPAPMAYADAPERFQSGTPNVPALYAARAGYEIVAEVGVEAIRAHSLALTRRIIGHAQAHGYPLHTPTTDAERGGTVTLGVAAGDRVAPALLARDVIVDYRPGAGIRMAPHFYTTSEDVDRALAVLDELVEQVAEEGRADGRPAGFGVRPL